MIESRANNTPKHWNLLNLALFYLLSLFTTIAVASTPLTQEEKDWIALHPTITYAAEFDWAPYDFQNPKGEHSGISRLYLDKISQLTGLKFQPVFDTWTNLVKQAKRGEIDLLPALYFDEKRTKFFLYSKPYTEIIDYIFARQDLDLKTWDNLNGRTMAIPKGYLHAELTKRRFPKTKLIETQTIDEAVTLVEKGNADLLLDAHAVISYIIQQRQLTNITPLRAFDAIDSRPLHMATGKNNKILISIINKALDDIPIYQRNQIDKRWLTEIYDPGSSHVNLSADEQQWINDHPNIRFAGDPNWLPYEAFDEHGNYIGIVSEYLKLIEQKLNIRLQLIPTKDWTETLELIDNGAVDIFSETGDSSLSEKFIFTQNYLSSPIIIVMRDDNSYIDGLSQIQKKNIAMIEQYGYVNTIKKAYPLINFSSVSSIQEGLTAVSTGKIDALVATLAQSSYHISAMGISNIHIVGKTEFRTQLAFGVRPDYAPLVEIFNRAIDKIDESEKQQILDNWGDLKFASRIDYIFVSKLAIGFLLLLGLILFWNRKLTKENRLRRDAEAQTQALIDHIPLQVMVMDYRGQILKANPQVLNDFEIHEDELSQINLISLIKSPSAREEVMRKLSTRGEVSQKIIQFKYPNTHNHSMMISIIPFHFQKKNTYLVISVDLSERLAIEAELLQAKERAEIANRTKSEFLANMSHEIRTPMNAILGFTELLKEQLTDHKLKGYVKTISSASNNLLLLINDILDLSKIEAGKMEVNLSPVNPHALFDELRQIFTHELNKKEIRFILDVDPSLPESLMLDLTRLRQVLVNLLGNAVKFTKSGHICLRATTEDTDLIRSTVNLRIDVEDSGNGIEKHQLESIFNEFQQSEGQDHAQYGGTGLGLTISKRLIALMGGTLTVISEPGKGTTFTVHLNSVAVASIIDSHESHSLQQINTVHFHPAMILVVDDIENNRQLITENFKDSSLLFVEACNGEEAINLVQQQHIDLILMDLRMPVMDGYQAAESIKSKYNIPIIALTASVMKDELDRLKQEHFDGYLRKPAKKIDLINLMIQYLPHEVSIEDAQPQTTLELSESEQVILPKLLIEIEQLHSQWQKIQQNNDLQETQVFANSLQKIGQKFSFSPLSQIANNLLEQIETFDIAGIDKELDRYETLMEILHQYKQQSKNINY